MQANQPVSPITLSPQLVRYLPIIGWATTYQRAWLRDDLVSGIVVGAIMVPVAMAYAEMAGAPPQAGLYSAILGLTAYALFATSRHLKVTTSSTMSIMSLAVVAPLAAGDPAALLLLSSALALTVGVILLVLGLMKLGFISDFLSKSVMTGYVFGVAFLIAISQLPKIFGIPGGSGTFFEQVRSFIANLPQTNVYTLAVGACAVIVILVLKRYKPVLPAAMVALVLGILASSLFQLNANYGVSVVGVIPAGMTSPALPKIPVSTIPFLAQTQGDTPPQAIVLDLGASADLDIGTPDMLRGLIDNLRRNHIDLLLAQVRGSVRRRMSITGLLDHIGENHIFPSVDAAAQSFLIRGATFAALPEATKIVEAATEVAEAAPDGSQTITT